MKRKTKPATQSNRAPRTKPVIHTMPANSPLLSSIEFETVPRWSVPQKTGYRKSIALMEAAMKAADADTERAVLLYNGTDTRLAANTRANAGRWLKQHNLTNTYSVVARGGKVYFWKS